jgi:hypothetical protein
MKQLLARRTTPGYDVPATPPYIPAPSGEPVINRSAIEADSLRAELGIQQATATPRVDIMSGGTEYVHRLEAAARSGQTIVLMLKVYPANGGETHVMHLPVYVEPVPVNHGTFTVRFSSRPDHQGARISVEYIDYCARNRRPDLTPAPLVG